MLYWRAPPNCRKPYAASSQKDQVMRDEMDNRLWVENHEAFTAGIDALIDKVKAVFDVLHRQQFCRPWVTSNDECDA